MVRVSYDTKPARRAMIETWGGSVVPSPSTDTNAGRTILERDPASTGSLGIAISEAVEDAATREDTKYSLGSVLNHVLLHQTVIGQEAQKQLAMADAYPDVVVGCVGGGSNFAGIAFPFVGDKAAGRDVRIVAAEPASCPSLTRGHYGYDFGDTAQMTPLLAMHTLGHTFMPAPIHAGGLRYHGMAPLVSKLVHDGVVEPVAYRQNECFAAAVEFARAEGIIAAPEATHAIRAVVDEVEKAREAGESRTILFNLCGHGHLELSAYQQFMAGELQDHELEQSALDEAAEVIAGMPAPA
jgi:tryptophan synthase beta chain